MKKGLFSFGALTAAFVPVIAVVSCGTTSNGSKETITLQNQAAFTAFAQSKGYNVKLASDDNITPLFKDSVKVIVKHGALNGSGDPSGTHGADDYAILVQGPKDSNLMKKSEQLTTTSGLFVAADGKTYVDVETKLDWPALSKKISINDRWGFSMKELASAKAIIYLQKDKDGVCTIGLERLANFANGKIAVTQDIDTNQDQVVAAQKS